MSDHIIKFAHGHYYTGKAGREMFSKVPHAALKDSKAAHENKLWRMADGINDWSFATVVNFDAECEAVEASYYERHTMAGGEI